jgi:membrane-associated phospholipid phosphatase
MHELFFKEKLWLGLAVIAFFMAMHFTTNYLSKLRNVQRCLALSIDKRLPFIPKLVYFYLFTYLFNTVCLFLMIYNRQMHDFLRAVRMMISVVVIGSIFYIIFPTVIRKPSLDEKNDISTSLVSAHNKHILPYNAFPSLHVAFSFITVLLAFEFDFSLRYLYAVILLLIAFSALFTKEHYVVDIIAGIVLGLLIYLAF